jgi:hypothetical protein
MPLETDIKLRVEFRLTKSFFNTPTSHTPWIHFRKTAHYNSNHAIYIPSHTYDIYLNNSDITLKN